MENSAQTRPNYVFTWKGALVLFFGGFVPLLGFSVLNVLSMIAFGKNFQYENWYLILSNALMWVGAIYAFDYFICRPSTGKKLSFNFSTKNVSTYLLIFPLMLGMMFIAEYFTELIPTTGPVFGELYEWFSQLMQMLSEDPLTMIVMAVVMAPIFEEIVFRGIIQKGLQKGGLSPITSIWISAIFFGIIHGNPWQFVGAVLLGYVLGLVYYRTKSLLMPILLHAFNNALSSILIMYSGTESFSQFFGIPSYALLGIGVVLFAFFFYLFTEKYEIHHAD
ncbi:CPBP family intramembrane glutamic endopeptidase [Chryseobacterium sp. A321]